MTPTLLSKYSKLYVSHVAVCCLVCHRCATRYAAVNDHGPAFGYGGCRPNKHAPLYPVRHCCAGSGVCCTPRYISAPTNLLQICDTQRNCGRCYELRCKQACLRNSQCNARCKAGSVTVLMVDACPSSAPFQIDLEKIYVRTCLLGPCAPAHTNQRRASMHAGTQQRHAPTILTLRRLR